MCFIAKGWRNFLEFQAVDDLHSVFLIFSVILFWIYGGWSVFDEMGDNVLSVLNFLYEPPSFKASKRVTVKWE